MTADLQEILDGIRLEIAATPKKFAFIVEDLRQTRDLYTVKISTDDSQARGLDESLEGAAAWWAGNPPGHADVLAVDPEQDHIHLRYVAPTPPEVGEKIILFPPLFLEALEEWWRDPLHAESGLRWLSEETAGRAPSDPPLSPQFFPWLRESQKSAFSLPRWNRSLLEGPPGTGKTRTLGAVLATYLIENQKSRVLLLSSTNTAVDLAITSVDCALDEIGQSAWNIRNQCKRIGHHFIARHYEDRQHLLPTVDERAITELAKAESQRPDPIDIVAYDQWKREVERLRARFRKSAALTLQSSRLSAMTACAAMFSRKAFAECAPFDLIVFDEASQVGLAYASGLATYGRHALFAGDPAQLAPIVQSEHRPVRRWLGRSPFDILTFDSSAPDGQHCFLEEQSRMRHEICSVVSRLFYGRRLRVATREQENPSWHNERKLDHFDADLNQGVMLQSVDASSNWSRKYHGPIRFASAEAVASLVERLIESEDPDDILVLTPFRAQRTLIRAMLRRRNIRTVGVSTVHKAQGSERRTVIFDPVDGSSQFLQREEAKRVVNVALSRAKARLVVFLSEVDCQNLLFRNLRIAVRDHVMNPETPALIPPSLCPIVELIRNGDLMKADLGTWVQIDTTIGKICNRTQSQLMIVDTNGEERIFSIPHLLRRFSNI